MNIAEKKEEILRLVEQLRPESAENLPTKRGGRKESPRRPGPRQPARLVTVASLDDRLADRRRALENIKRRRDKMGLDLLEDRILSICQSLEDRISKIEQALRHGVPRPKNYSRDEGDTGTELASNLDDVLPDINTDVSPPSKPAASESRRRSDAAPRSSSLPKRPSFPARKPSNRPGASLPERPPFLSGIIQEAMLPDILQLISSNDKTGVFRCERDGKNIDLYFRDGHLYHALGENMNGQSAFFAAMALPEGNFYFNETDDVPEERTIDGNTQFMILEALRQIDEERSGE
jgi:hypothetical protein